MVNWFDLGPFFAKRSTPSERLVLVWAIIVLLIALGIFCLYLGFTAPAAKAQEAAQLKTYGFASLGLALIVWLGYRFVVWLLDR